MAAATGLCAAYLACSPAVVTATRAELDFPSTAAAPPAAAQAFLSATPESPQPTIAAPPVAFVVPDRPEQWFQPSGRNQGTEGLVDSLTQLALHDNAPLYISEGWGRTTGDPTSDHHISRTDSWAADVAVRGIQQPTPATALAAKRISSALGEPNWTGGDLTRTIGGYRFQILWLVAGHFNHVHVGVRKVG